MAGVDTARNATKASNLVIDDFANLVDFVGNQGLHDVKNHTELLALMILQVKGSLIG